MASPAAAGGPSVEEREETTLDEPVSATLKREFQQIADKMWKVAMPGSDSKTELRNWDLWGPLILCLVLAIILSSGPTHPGIYNKAGELVKPVGAKDDSAAVFASVFLIIWCGSAVVTVNAVLLGGTVSFFQSICILGYCVFPLNVAALVAMAVGWTACTSTTCFLIRFSSVVLGLGWATRASNGFMSQVVPNKRSALAIYPVYLFYMALAWIILIRSSP